MKMKQCVIISWLAYENSVFIRHISPSKISKIWATLGRSRHRECTLRHFNVKKTDLWCVSLTSRFFSHLFSSSEEIVNWYIVFKQELPMQHHDITVLFIQDKIIYFLWMHVISVRSLIHLTGYGMIVADFLRLCNVAAAATLSSSMLYCCAVG